MYIYICIYGVYARTSYFCHKRPHYGDSRRDEWAIKDERVSVAVKLKRARRDALSAQLTFINAYFFPREMMRMHLYARPSFYRAHNRVFQRIFLFFRTVLFVDLLASAGGIDRKFLRATYMTI